jgi:hypothetical protein
MDTVRIFFFTYQLSSLRKRTEGIKHTEYRVIEN